MIEISGFVKNTLRFVEPTELFQSAEFLTRADKLWKSGVIFVEGVSDAKNGQKIIAAIYDGQVIAQGTKIEVIQELKGLSKLEGKELVEGLAKAIKKGRNLDDTIIAELKAAGVKFTESDLKWVFKNKVTIYNFTVNRFALL